jgi:glutamate synthase (NADPH/NADH) small chain
MGNPTGFILYKRADLPKRKIDERIKDYREIEGLLPQKKLKEQATRCMNCGVPTCHMFGCPVENRIPDFNDLLSRDHWHKALDVLHATINFPEFTGRICPAPCEAACTLAINELPVTIRHIELQIVEHGWQMGWIKPEPASFASGKKVAVVGSGPAGLAAAQQLVRNGHQVVVFEKAGKIGGLLRYGIPDFKLEKHFIDRRLQQMETEGVVFEPGVDIGKDISLTYLQRAYHAVLITAGATVPRDLSIPGRALKGIHFAMEFLTRQNQQIAGNKIAVADEITAKGKNVVVIGGGDTGSDCVGTSIRQGAKKVIQVEILPKPPDIRPDSNPWPTWPKILRNSTSHEEGCERYWNIASKEFVGKDGRLEKVKYSEIAWNNAMTEFKELPGTTGEYPADLVLLSMGFLHVQHNPLFEDFAIKSDPRGNIIVDANMMSIIPGIFAAGDSVTGASLVVTALYQGRRAAEGINRYLSSL